MTNPPIPYTTCKSLAVPSLPPSRCVIAARRAIAVLLALGLAPVLTLALLTSQTCGTLLSSDFYKEQLRKAGIYDFLYDDLLIAVIDEGLEEAEDLPPGVDLEAEDVVDDLRGALPPDWLQEQVESAIDSVGPYLFGQSDSFTLTVRLADRTDAAEAAATSILDRIGLHESVFAEEVPDVVAKRMGDGRELPLEIQLTQEEAVAAIERVVTPSHVRSQQTQAAEALAAYLVGRTDTFDFTFDFSERTSVLEHELTEVFEDADLEGYVRREVLEPALDENVTADVAMPLGVVVSRWEIRQAIEAVITDDWLAVEARRLVDAIVPYLSGRRDGFELRVDLLERTDAAIQDLTFTVKNHYSGLLATVPQCTAMQLRALAQGNAIALCKPEGFTTDDFLWAAGIDVEASLGAAVHDMAPDFLTFTDEDLAAELEGTDNEELVTDLREVMLEGLTIDEGDLQEALAEQDEGLPSAVDTLREGFSEGWTWTEEDLRDVIADPGSSDAQETLDAFDAARGALGSVWLVSALMLAVSLGLAAGAGLLGGRTWVGKLGWAGGALAFAALMVFILSGPVYGSLAGGALDEARAEVQDDDASAFESLLAGKLLDIANQASDDIGGGVRLRALLLLLLGVLAVAGSVVWATQKPGQAPPPGPVGPPETPPAEAEAASPAEEAAPAGGEQAEEGSQSDEPAPAEDGSDEQDDRPQSP